MNIETLIVLVAGLVVNCGLYFVLGMMWQYRRECRRAGNM
jgi:hypothetical protein